METHKIQSANAYIDRNIYVNKNVPVKETGDVDKANVPNKVNEAKVENVKNLSNSSSEAILPVSISVTFSIEKDLNIVVTRVIDGTTKQVLRQIPAEEVVKRKKLTNIYNQTLAVIGLILDTVVE